MFPSSHQVRASSRSSCRASLSFFSSQSITFGIHANTDDAPVMVLFSRYPSDGSQQETRGSSFSGCPHNAFILKRPQVLLSSHFVRLFKTTSCKIHRHTSCILICLIFLLFVSLPCATTTTRLRTAELSPVVPDILVSISWTDPLIGNWYGNREHF